MKFTKCLLMVTAALAGMVLVTALPLHAQSLALRANIPFEFQAGNKVLPAGTYTFEKRGDALLISDGKGNGAAVIANAIPNKAYRLASLIVFKGYGDKHFLSEVRWSDYSTARGLIESSDERRLAKALAAAPLNVAANTPVTVPPGR